MIIEGNSDIITQCEFFAEEQGQPTQRLTFRNGFVLVLAQHFMALYKSVDAIHDPLGNGLKALVDLPSDSQLSYDSTQGFVTEYSAGFVGLHNDKAILITPNDIQLFPHKLDALHNRNEIARLALA